MKEKNTTHLAGEFLVAGEMARRGYPVSITMGNAKSVDIYPETKKDRIKIDAKAGRAKGNWPMHKQSIQPDVYYVFVHLGTDLQIEKNSPPEYFIVKGNEIQAKNLIETWGKRSGIPYKALRKFKGKWGKRPKHK